MLHQVGVSFDLYYDARKHKIKKKRQFILYNALQKNSRFAMNILVFIVLKFLNEIDLPSEELIVGGDNA